MDGGHDLDSWWRRFVSPWHDGHDRWPQGACGVRTARRAQQGGCNTRFVAPSGARSLHLQTTMTTIGLVSAGLLTFPQGLGLVLGANAGTTGTGWVALIGVRVSLTAAALPMIFVGALVTSGARACVCCACGPCRIRARAFWIDRRCRRAWADWPNGCTRRT